MKLNIREFVKKNVWFIAISLVFIVFMGMRFVGHYMMVSGESMMPTLEDGQLLSVQTDFTTEDLTYDTIICFNSHDFNKKYIKRIVGLPGDTIQIKNGSLYRNGEKVTDDFPLMQDAGNAGKEFYLKDEEYYVLGDNRNHSSDSRVLGAISYEDIVGICKIK